MDGETESTREADRSALCAAPELMAMMGVDCGAASWLTTEEDKLINEDIGTGETAAEAADTAA